MTKSKVRRTPATKPTKLPDHVATRQSVQKENRRIVPTKDGLFVVKKIQGMDFVFASSPLFRQKAEEASGLTKAATKIAKKKAEKDSGETFADYVNVVLTRGVISCTIYKVDGKWSLEQKLNSDVEAMTSSIVVEDEVDESKYQISAFDLDQQTLITLMAEVQDISGMNKHVALEARLKRF